jgi:predicted TIM-barrel fold metal-dependent hydrolase
MKIKTIAIEEHFEVHTGSSTTASMTPAPGSLDLFTEIGKEQRATWQDTNKKLLDLGNDRLADMDAWGIDMQVLQLSGHGLESMEQHARNVFVQEANDQLAEVIKKYPDRYAGFAKLNLLDPEAAAAELERSVTRLGLKGGTWNGRCNGHYLDHPSFNPVWQVAEKLEVPIYLHPGVPAKDLVKALYTELPDGVIGTVALAGWGWHMENGFHALHLVLSGLFDRFPKLQIIIGHMGEGIPFALERANTMLNPSVTHLQKNVREYFLSNFHLTTSGFFSIPTLLCAIMVFGIDRIIFSVDYPYSSNEQGRRFLDAIPLSPADLEKIAHINAEKLLRL